MSCSHPTAPLPRPFAETVVRPTVSKLLWWRRLHRADLRLPVRMLGDTPRYAWPVIEASLRPESVVYSFGIGTNASYELALTAIFGCPVWAFDPTPVSVAWAQAQDHPAHFRFIPWGLGPADRLARFHAPSDPDHVSYSILGVTDHANDIMAPIRSLPSIMADLGHDKIDLLKMDVEGSEYAVLESLVRSAVRPVCLLVEFHQGFYGCSAAMTRHAVEQLRDMGYAIFWVSDRGLEYGFVHCGSADDAVSVDLARRQQ